MRACWIILTALGLLPAGLFYVLDWTGATGDLDAARTELSQLHNASRTS